MTFMTFKHLIRINIHVTAFYPKHILYTEYLIFQKETKKATRKKKTIRSNRLKFSGNLSSKTITIKVSEKEKDIKRC